MSSSTSSTSSAAHLAPEMLTRHYVISKGKLLKKPRIMHISKDGISMADPASQLAKAHKAIKWTEINEIVVPETSETEVLIKYAQKNKRLFHTEHRAQVLTDIYDYYKQSIDSVTFKVEKQTKTLQRTSVLIRLNPASLDHLRENTTFTTHQYCKIRKIDIVKNSNGFVIYLNKSRKLLFYSDERDKIVEKIKTNMKQYLQLTLKVENLETADNLFQAKEASIRSYYTVLVDKVELNNETRLDNLLQYQQQAFMERNSVANAEALSSFVQQDTGRLKVKARRLLLSKDGLFEVDPLSTLVLSMHRYTEIFSIVRSPVENDKLIIEYDSDHITIYKTSERDELISSIIEFAGRSKVMIPIHRFVSQKNLRIGRIDTSIAQAEELVLKRVGQVKLTTPAEWLPALTEMNENFGPRHSPTKDKKAFQTVIAILKMLTEADMAEKKKSAKGMTTLSAKNIEMLTAVLLALTNLLAIPACNEAVASNVADFSAAFRYMQFDDPYLAYLSARVLRLSIDQPFEHKTEKKEQANKAALLRESSLAVMFGTLENRVGNLKQYGLVVNELLAILETSLYSGVSSTDRNLFQLIHQQAMKSLKYFFMCCKLSKSAAVQFNAVVVLRVLLQCTPKEKLQVLQCLALEKTQLLQIILLSVLTEDPAVVVSCADILGYLSEGSEDSTQALYRILPKAFFKSLSQARGNSEEYKHLSKKIHTPQKRLDSTVIPASTLRGNWPALLLRTKQNEASIAVIWDDRTRKELRICLQEEITRFEKVRAQYPTNDVVWNYEEYSVPYDCLKEEPKVGQYYIAFLLDKYSSSGLGKHETIENPTEFIEQLHHNIMFSDEAFKVKCIEASTTVYTLYRYEIGAYPYVHHICHLLQKAKNTTVIYAILKFLFQLLMNEHNVVQFIKSKGISIIMELITLAHQNAEPIHQDITLACVRVLLRLSTFHTSQDEDGRILVPAPVAKQLMCDASTLPHIVQLLTLFANQNIFTRTVTLLRELVLFNDLLMPEFYTTGVFYFVFLCENLHEFEDIAILLKETHATQNTVVDEVYTGLGDDLSPPIKSVLNGILPKEMIHRLQTVSTFEFGKAFLSDVCTPYMIWNKEMRETLRRCIMEHVREFIQQLSSNRVAVYKLKKLPPIKYTRLENEFVVYHYYMSTFVDTTTWPVNFKLEESAKFLEATTSALASKLTVADRSVNESLISMCLRAQLLLMRNPAPAFSNYSAANSLVECLKPFKVGASTEYSKGRALVTYQSLELINQIMRLSKKNIASFLEIQIIENVVNALEAAMAQVNVNNVSSEQELTEKKKQHYDTRYQKVVEKFRQHRRQTSHGGDDDDEEEAVRAPNVQEGDDYILPHCNIDEILMVIIQQSLTLLLYLAEENEETMLYVAKAPSLIQTILQCFRLPLEKGATIIDSCLQLLAFMCASSSLQERCFMSGIIMYPIYYITLHGTATVPMIFSERSVAVLKRMSGWMPPVKGREFPNNGTVQKALSQILSANLIFRLRNDTEKEFLDSYLRSVEEPKILWNDFTRQELSHFAIEQINAICNKTFNSASILSFIYQTHARELMALGIFVRFYNLKPTFPVENPAGFVEKMLILLREEHTKFIESKEEDITRLSSLVEAIHNVLLAYKDVAPHSNNFAEYFPSLLMLLKHKHPYEYVVYYTMEIIFHFINSSNASVNATIIQSFVKHGILDSLRDLLYAQLSEVLQSSKVAAGTLLDLLTENVMILLFKIFTFSDNPLHYSKSFSNGLFFFVFFVFAGLFCSRDVLRKKAAFVLSFLLKDPEADRVCKIYLPAVLADNFRTNPSAALALFDQNHEFPELIWNEEMRSLLRQKITEQVYLCFQTFKTSPTASIPESCSQFSINYTYPRKIQGIYTANYIMHPNYPIANMEQFLASLIDELLTKQHNEAEAYELAGAINTCLGGDYFAVKSVNLMYLHSGKIATLLSATTGRLQQKVLTITQKMSLASVCIENFSSVPNLTSLFITAMEAMPDHISALLEVLLRFVVKSKMITLSIVTPTATCLEHPLIQYLLEILKSSRGPQVKQRAAQIFKHLCTEENAFQTVLSVQHETEYKTYVETATVSQEDLFKLPLAPPIYTGGILGYMKIVPESKTENQKDISFLFVRLSDELYGVIYPRTGGAANNRMSVRNSMSLEAPILTKQSSIIATLTGNSNPTLMPPPISAPSVIIPPTAVIAHSPPQLPKSLASATPPAPKITTIPPPVIATPSPTPIIAPPVVVTPVSPQPVVIPPPPPIFIAPQISPPATFVSPPSPVVSPVVSPMPAPMLTPSAGSTGAPPPPPPPPPPIAAPLPPALKTPKTPAAPNNTTSSPSVESSPAAGSRVSLLDQIRDFGQRKESVLKKVNRDESPSPKPASNSTTSTMFNAIQDRLKSMRSGIAGEDQEHHSDSDDSFDDD